MLSGTLWPAHPKPFPDELLSSWIVRIARANGLKLQTFTRRLFGEERVTWNRDIDRLAPDWLLNEVCARTGTPFERAYDASLAAYEGRLFPARHPAGQLRWITTLKIHGTKRGGPGIQFCPRCLAGDAEPYFRRCWRVAFSTFCPRHGIMLSDICPGCGEPVAFHRRDFNRQAFDAGPMCSCHACNFDLRQAPVEPAIRYEAKSFALMRKMLAALEKPASSAARFNLEFHAALHQLCKLMVSRRRTTRLGEYVAERIGIEDRSPMSGRFAFENRSLLERHYAIHLAMWLMVDLEKRLPEAWQAKAVRYNALLKDFRGAPEWYTSLVIPLNDRRSR